MFASAGTGTGAGVERSVCAGTGTGAGTGVERAKVWKKLFTSYISLPPALFISLSSLPPSLPIPPPLSQVSLRSGW